MTSESILAEMIDGIVPEGAYVVLLHHVYFDESGTHAGSPAMSLAAYVFEKGQAMRFARDWSRDLERLNLPFAHMTDCANGNAHYAELTLDQRINSGKSLIAHIKRRTRFGVAAGVPVASFKRATDWDRYAMSSYTMCLTFCVQIINDWADKNCPDARFAYFFESGQEDAVEANRVMNALPHSKDGERYVAHAFIGKRDATQLQAADMLAWQLAHHLRRKGEGHPVLRKDFVALMREKDHIQEMTEAMLEHWSDVQEKLNWQVLQQIRPMIRDASELHWIEQGLLKRK